MPPNRNKEGRSRRHASHQRSSTDHDANRTYVGVGADRYITPHYEGSASYDALQQGPTSIDHHKSESYGGSSMWSTQGMASSDPMATQAPVITSSGQSQGSTGYAYLSSPTSASYQVGATCYTRSSSRRGGSDQNYTTDNLTRNQSAQPQQSDYDNINFSGIGGHLKKFAEPSGKSKHQANSDPLIYGAATHEATFTTSPEQTTQSMSDSMEIQVGSPPRSISSLDNYRGDSRGSSTQSLGRQPHQYQSIASTTNPVQSAQMPAPGTSSSNREDGAQYWAGERWSMAQTTQIHVRQRSQRSTDQYPPSSFAYQPSEGSHNVSVSSSRGPAFQEQTEEQQMPSPSHANTQDAMVGYRTGQRSSQGYQHSASGYSTAYAPGSADGSQRFYNTQQHAFAYSPQPDSKDPQGDNYQSYYQVRR